MKFLIKEMMIFLWMMGRRIREKRRRRIMRRRRMREKERWLRSEGGDWFGNLCRK